MFQIRNSIIHIGRWEECSENLSFSPQILFAIPLLVPLYTWEVLNLQRSGMLLVVIPLLFVCEHSRPFSSGGLRPNCLPSRCHTQQPLESRAGAGEQTTIPPAGPEGVCLPQVPGAVQLGWVQRKGWRGGEKRAMASVYYPNLTCLLPRLRDFEINHKTAFTSPCAIRPSLLMSPSLLYRECQNSLVGQNCYSQKIVQLKDLVHPSSVFIQYVTKSICIIQKKIYE